MNWKRDIMNESLIDAIQKPGPRDLDCDRSDPNVGVFHAQACLQIGCSFFVFIIVLMLVFFRNRVQEISIVIAVTLMWKCFMPKFVFRLAALSMSL